MKRRICGGDDDMFEVGIPPDRVSRRREDLWVDLPDSILGRGLGKARRHLRYGGLADGDSALAVLSSLSSVTW